MPSRIVLLPAHKMPRNTLTTGRVGRTAPAFAAVAYDEHQQAEYRYRRPLDAEPGPDPGERHRQPSARKRIGGGGRAAPRRRRRILRGRSERANDGGSGRGSAHLVRGSRRRLRSVAVARGGGAPDPPATAQGGI